MTDPPRLNPHRITIALDMAGQYGPEVDAKLGGREPMVDQWEAGVRVPTSDQLTRLALLTGLPVSFFYLPDPLDGPVWLCRRTGRGNGCQVVYPSWSKDPAVQTGGSGGQDTLW